MAYVHVTCKPMQVYTYPRVNYVVIETEEVKAADSFLEAFLYGGLKRDIKGDSPQNPTILYTKRRSRFSI